MVMFGGVGIALCSLLGVGRSFNGFRKASIRSMAGKTSFCSCEGRQSSGRQEEI